MTQPVLDIQQLHLSFPGFNGDVHALNNVSLQINRGEIVGLVGESGSGKSVTAMLYASATDGQLLRTSGADFTAGRRCS